MRIWCEVHDSQKYAIKQPPQRCDFVMLHGNWKSDPPCVFVPMRLIPDNAETVIDPDEVRRVIDKTIAFDQQGVLRLTDDGRVLVAAARAYLALNGETP